MTNLERLARKYYQDRPEGFGEPTADFAAGFAEAQRQMHGCALLMPEPHPTMYWLHKLNEWAMSEEDKRFELKFKKET